MFRTLLGQGWGRKDMKGTSLAGISHRPTCHVERKHFER